MKFVDNALEFGLDAMDKVGAVFCALGRVGTNFGAPNYSQVKVKSKQMQIARSAK
jgi:hypothetical protein